MYRLIDYINWRGDYSFDELPFNAVDFAVLCQMSYFDMSIGFSSGDSLTFKQTYETSNDDSKNNPRAFIFSRDEVEVIREAIFAYSISCGIILILDVVYEWCMAFLKSVKKKCYMGNAYFKWSSREKITHSAILVAWSPIRSRYLLTMRRSAACSS
ncbi:MAG: hypothetical protein K6F92_03960 [Lachnospiraceae bacterium]|nr:hypothetical protein [Lachnospiraceae bacterium]